jgi:RNA polymerase sigma-70 factor (ECF subfamily)
MPGPDDIQQIVVRELMAGRNVEANFHRLFDKYYGAILASFLRKGCGDYSLDLTQEVFTAVYAGIGTLRNPEFFATWLFRIAENLYFRHMYKIAHRPAERAAAAGSEDLSETVPWPGRNPLDLLLEIETTEVMREAIETLAERERECLRAQLDGLDNREIGRRLGINPTTVAVHLFRGRKKLKRLLEKMFPSKPPKGSQE